MSTPASTPSHGAIERSPAAPYAFPQARSASIERGLQSGWANVGPYVPEPWRGKPVVERPVTPRFVAPIASAHAPPAEMPATGMPPSYPTPAYFTPLGSQAQDDFVTPAFALPAFVDATEEVFAVSLIEPPPPLEPEVASLPWIDAFLSSTPAMPMRAVDESTAPHSPPASDTPMPSDAWALDEAAAQLRSLADELRDHEGIASDAGESARLFDASLTPEPLPAWSDDDLIDIMPLQKDGAIASARVPTPGSSSVIEPWADRARRAGEESAEAAAKALEVLARRVRDGEISLAGYEPRLGDAAALAAALAALLGVRR
ncbi:hypothetical protein [Gemmatimonas sp.]|uniref:hypothetical protein n=1 Tax=Gemmatimonas sp. TaxID=1962908 RepID=UPI0039835C90